MLEGGLAAVLEFGSLGLLGTFLYFAYQSYKDQQQFQQKLTGDLMEVTRSCEYAHTNSANQFELMCKDIENKRDMEEKEHQALMKQHETLMEDHKRITQKLMN